ARPRQARDPRRDRGARGGHRLRRIPPPPPGRDEETSALGAAAARLRARARRWIARGEELTHTRSPRRSPEGTGTMANESQLRASEIKDVLLSQIEKYEEELHAEETGEVLEVKDGVAR